MSNELPPDIVYGYNSADFQPSPLPPDHDIRIMWQEENKGGPSEQYTALVRLTDSNGKQSSSDLTCSPLGEGEYAIRTIDIRGGLPAGVSADVDVWIAYEVFGIHDELSPHHFRLHIPLVGEMHHAVQADHAAWPGHPLQLHSHEKYVGVWQERLKHLGHHVSVDDKFGPNTEKATKKLQEAKGLDPTGVVDSHTWDAAWK